MPAEQVTQMFKKLPLAKKIALIGGFLMMISLFMPWYQDIDSFKTGDLYLGVTGPTYLLGISLLALAAVNVAAVVMDELGKKMPFMNVKTAKLNLWSGVAAFYFLILVDSIYFHPNFGVNISIKQSDFGNFFAFIAASMLTIGGYLASRDKQSLLRAFEEETADDMIKIPDAALRKPQPIRQTATLKREVVANVTPEETVANIDAAVNTAMETKQKPAPYSPTEKEQAMFEKLRERAGLSTKSPINRGFERGTVGVAEPERKAPQAFRTDL